MRRLCACAMLGSASASMRALGPAVMRLYSINLQVADLPGSVSASASAFWPAVMLPGDVYAIGDLWNTNSNSNSNTNSNNNKNNYLVERWDLRVES